MQHLKQLVQQARNAETLTDQNIINLTREYLQVQILKAIYQSKYGRGLAFMGGTCLRICHDLRRYSEDLDFARDRVIPDYSLADLDHGILLFLTSHGFELDMTVNEDKTVQKSFFRFANVLEQFDLNLPKNQKIHIKMEIDTNPVPVSDDALQSYFVNKFDEIFPVLKHNEPTLFAGKISAILNRAYDKGRDYYDLIWYLKRGQTINLDYLNLNLQVAGGSPAFHTGQDVIAALDAKIRTADLGKIVQDIIRFLEDPDEKVWLEDYLAVFQQISSQWLHRIR
ncbi:hypothetical protein AUK40_04830 [Candidatus Wirthbacteria bacterium CG2_30_54_11]|uniref:Nucleotidyltransferase n=1 Tax=Candidatus Wirthbacteria bacterium CG2_30_54_11 TaxID=1817892 RepID=A0A1J5IHQ6_9BACT|nr:MAG: hypothetical protein AUK40_04830 [Candidatus Wirthbacteria bacterium CG2_30_54_11]